MQVGVYTEYDEAGNITAGALYEQGLKIGEGVTNAEGKRTGEWKQFYADGAQIRRAFAEGKREALEVTRRRVN